MRADLTIAEPAGGLIGTAAGLRDQPASLTLRLDGPATGARLDARGTIGPDVALALTGTLRAGAKGSYGAVLEGEIAARPLLPPALRDIATPFVFRLDAALSPAQRLSLTEARFTVPAGALRLSGTADLPAGIVDLAYAVELADSTRFAGFVPDAASWQSLSAGGRVQGATAAPRVTAEVAVAGFGSRIAQLAALLGETPRASLTATLPDRVERLELRGAAIAFDLAGHVATPLDATARLTFADLSVLGTGFAGALRAELHATGATTDPSLALTASGDALLLGGQSLTAPALAARIEAPFTAPRAEARLAARYAGLPLTLDLLGRPEGQSLRLERATAAFGPAAIEAQGLLDLNARLFEGSLVLDAPHLAPFSDLAGTPLSGGVRVAGSFSTRNEQQVFDVRADVSALRAGSTEAAGSATARGTLAEGTVTFDGTAVGAALRTSAAWRTTPQGRSITLPVLEARYRGEAFRLAAPARLLMLPEGGVMVEPLSLAPARGGTLGIAGRWGPDRADVTVTIGNVPARLVTALAGAGAPVEGLIGGRMRLAGPVAAPDWQAELRATGLRATARWAARLPAAEIRIDGNGTAASRAELRATISAGAAVRLSGVANLPRGFAATAPLAMSLDGNADLAVLSAPFLAGGADRVTGRLVVALRAQGSLGAPQFGGEATLSAGAYRNPVLGIALADIAGTLAGQEDHLTIRRLTARTAGGGSVALQGTLQAARGGIGTDITIQARNARPVQSDLLTTTFDADLALTGTLPDAARISGTINLARTEIRVPENLPPSVRSIPNVRERGRRPARATHPASTPAAAALPPVVLALQIEAPRAIFVRGRGLDAELGGAIEIGGTLGDPVPRGGFDLRRGTLSILDRQLTYRQGRIEFNAGSLMPSLDMEAESRVREATLRVNVSGPANDPRLTFSSSPELPQDEILSRLLFDRSARELSPFQIAALAQAAAGAMGYEGPTSGGVLNRIRRTLALDRLSVGSAQQGEGRSDGTSAVVEGGRYVAPGVYVGVRQGTTGGAPRVGVQLDVLPRVRVEAETGGNSRGGDRVGVSFELEY